MSGAAPAHRHRAPPRQPTPPRRSITQIPPLLEFDHPLEIRLTVQHGPLAVTHLADRAGPCTTTQRQPPWEPTWPYSCLGLFKKNKYSTNAPPAPPGGSWPVTIKTMGDFDDIHQVSQDKGAIPPPPELQDTHVEAEIRFGTVPSPTMEGQVTPAPRPSVPRRRVDLPTSAEISHARLSHDCKEGADAVMLHLFSKETAHMRPLKRSF